MNSLKNIEYIAADLGPERGLNQECTLVEVTNLLQNKGFCVVGFHKSRITALFKNSYFEENQNQPIHI